MFDVLGALSGSGAGRVAEKRAGAEETHWRAQQVAKATASPELYAAATGREKEASTGDMASQAITLASRIGLIGAPFSPASALWQIGKTIGAVTGFSDDEDERREHRDMWGD